MHSFCFSELVATFVFNYAKETIRERERMILSLY